MAITIRTPNPLALKTLLYQKIDNNTARTWGRRGRAEQLTHTAEQYENLAWFTPKPIIAGEQFLTFYINLPNDTPPTIVRYYYSIYHGRFTELLISHLYPNCSSVDSSTRPDANDVMSPELRKILNT